MLGEAMMLNCVSLPTPGSVECDATAQRERGRADVWMPRIRL